MKLNRTFPMLMVLLAVATVNRELNLLSSAFSLAVLYDKAEFNPCSKVDLFPLDNLRYRYLLPTKNHDSWQNSTGLAPI
jgi:hypothetical protein